MRVLDLFCCAGGAGVGYSRAGFEVVGVDIVHRPRYPHRFVLDDALAWASVHGHEFDLIHASPPCQASCALTKGTNRLSRGRVHLDLIADTRHVLDAVGVPYVIENVQGSALRRDLTLCGEMFGLGVLRHRYFELGGWTTPPPAHRPHRGRVAGMRHGTWYAGPYLAVYGEGGGKGTVQQWQQAMGIDWTTSRRELAEAIPPAYTHWIAHAYQTARQDTLFTAAA